MIAYRQVLRFLASLRMTVLIKDEIATSALFRKKMLL